MPKSDLVQINLTVADLDTSVAFYRLLGLKIPKSAIWRTESGAHRCAFSTGGLTLVINSVALAKAYNKGYRKARGGSAVFNFAFDSRKAVDAAYERATAAGHRGLQPPFDAFWGSRFAVVEDPDGNHIGLRSEPDAKMAWDIGDL